MEFWSKKTERPPDGNPAPLTGLFPISYAYDTLYDPLSRTGNVVINKEDNDSLSFNAPYDVTVKTGQEYTTRQLPMGAGHCQLGGLTDRNVCKGWSIFAYGTQKWTTPNIHGDAHLASRYRVMPLHLYYIHFGISTQWVVAGPHWQLASLDISI